MPDPDGAFDVDFGVDEWHGTNAFIRDGDHVFRTYFINDRGDEVFVNTFHFLDMTALGRQEIWEDSPDGLPADQALRMVALARRIRRNTRGDIMNGLPIPEVVDRKAFQAELDAAR